MIVSSFSPNLCPAMTEIVEELIRTRKIKEMMNTTDKPVHAPHPHDTVKQKPKEFVVESKITLRNDVKKRIYKRNSSLRLVRKYKLQAKYNIFLLNYLHKTSHLEAIRNAPIYPSALDTKEEPSYPFNYEEQAYKKEYPHYSNIVSLPRIPFESSNPLFISPHKVSGHFPDVYSSTCVTLQQLFQFCSNFLLNEDVSFEKIATKLNMAQRSVKFMYETINHMFELDYISDKLSRYKVKEKMGVAYQRYCSRIKDAIVEGFSRRECSRLIPRMQIMVSLREVHLTLRDMEIDII